MRTLLLADDSITVQRVIGLTFATEDFRVVTVSDGQAAIDRIRSQPPDIVLAGAAMPNVSGYDVASFVRSQPALKRLPVLLLTGAFDTVDPERLKTSGANGVLEKPLDPTTVISRVKELLGIKGDARPTPAPGRLVTPAETPAETPADKKQSRQREAPASSQARRAEPPPIRASKAEAWDELREASGLAPDALSVESGNGSGGEDYLDTLDAAFDSLDQKLAGRGGDKRHARRHDDPPPRNNRDGRNPAPPLAHQGTAADPRAPSRRPAAPVAQEAPEKSAVYEVDDWFAGDEKDREERLAEQKELAAEMGIRDVELPDNSGTVDGGDANADLDFEFGPDGEPKPVEAPNPPEAATARMPDKAAPMPSSASARGVADDFATLLAFEQGERPHPPARSERGPAPGVVRALPAEITDAMLDQIAERVVDRLNAGSFADHIREAMTATVRETVRTVVSDTSERLVRDEIARLKAQAERDTH
jgi:CheY-like chemotaxis protein